MRDRKRLNGVELIGIMGRYYDILDDQRLSTTYVFNGRLWAGLCDTMHEISGIKDEQILDCNQPFPIWVIK